MLLAYTDESYSDDCFSLAALLCPENQINPLTHALDQVMREISVENPELDEGLELHGFEIFHGRGRWKPLRQDRQARKKVFNRAFDAIASYDVKIIIEGIDPVSALRYDQPQNQAIKHLLERLNENSDEQPILVIADELNQSAHKLHREQLNTYRVLGTSGYKHQVITKIVDTLHFAPSDASRLIQAADLIAFITRRRQTIKSETNAQLQIFMDQLYQRIRPRVVCSRFWSPK